MPNRATRLPNRSLGPLRVSAVGLGAMVLSPGLYGAVDDDVARRALRHALDRGCTFVDTGDTYGGGRNEELVGRAIAGRRDVVVSTKFGLRIPDGAARHRVPVGYAYGHHEVNAEPRHVRGYALASLQRLGVECLDLYAPHFPDPAVPIEDTVGAIVDLVREGVVRCIGLSNATATDLRRALAVHPIAAVQLEWSMWKPIDPELLAVASANAVGLVAWGPLGSGFLADTVAEVGPKDFRRNAPRFAVDNLSVNRDRYAPIRTLAAELGVGPARLALAWLLHQYHAVVPIPGSRTPSHIDDNLAAATMELDAGIRSRLDAAVAAFEPIGETLL
ncbi:MAG TPA: aldo/keto reductase [Acidimicrobiales bacterium]|nr:aldo/keto reductase [Acidimicrobiales bacterium]